MTHLKVSSLGTVAALLAFGLAQSEAENTVQLSSISNLSIGSGDSLTLDIDGNGEDDFQLSDSPNQGFFFEGLAGNNGFGADTVDNEAPINPYLSGETIAFSDTFSTHVLTDHLRDTGTNFVGFRFFIGEEIHLGWMQLSYPPASSETFVVSAAWETAPQVSLVAGVVPEPSTAGLLVLGLAALGTRRNRRHESGRR